MRQRILIRDNFVQNFQQMARLGKC